MKILLTGANGYIGRRLIPVLYEQGHQLVALVRDPSRLRLPEPLRSAVQVITGDLLRPDSLQPFPQDIDAAYYLVHSMGHTSSEFYEMEQKTAHTFVDALNRTQCHHLIYLSGLSHDSKLSRHLASRHKVEETLAYAKAPLTVLRAGIIIGSGSASFEIIRDLVEKLRFMVAPKWVSNKSQPISIIDVLHYLVALLGHKDAFDCTFDIGGPNILTYKEMLMGYAKVRGLKRTILSVPVLTPRLSSYWLYFVTSTNFKLAQSLVDSLKNNAYCQECSIDDICPHTCLTYEEALHRVFSMIEENMIVSSWKDAWLAEDFPSDLSHYVNIPRHGCVREEVQRPLKISVRQALDRIWAIGGDNGWYYMNWAWSLRGFLDKLVGGVGLRRGRTHPTRLRPGDALDFWRVVLADRVHMRLLLYAEMKTPGEAWLELKIVPTTQGAQLHSIASFRPHGLLGRLYWWSLWPIHTLIFRGMIRKLATP